VFLQGSRIYQDIVNVTDAKDIEVFTESVIHQSLGSSWSFGEPKGHNEEFKEAIASSEGDFSFITFFDTDLVKASSEVKVGEIFTTMNLVEAFFNSA